MQKHCVYLTLSGMSFFVLSIVWWCKILDKNILPVQYYKYQSSNHKSSHIPPAFNQTTIIITIIIIIFIIISNLPTFRYSHTYSPCIQLNQSRTCNIPVWGAIQLTEQLINSTQPLPRSSKEATRSPLLQGLVPSSQESPPPSLF